MPTLHQSMRKQDCDMIMNTTDSPGLLSRLQKIFRRNYKKTVLSFLLSGININLAVSLEMWTKTCGRLPLLLFTGIGFVLCFALTFSFLMREERRLKVHALLWGILMTFAYVLGCRMRRDNTALRQWSDLPFLLAHVNSPTTAAMGPLERMGLGYSCHS